jgi:hypothetical protein
MNDENQIRQASCACGAVRVTAMGTPAVVNICACLDCQKRSASAFTYTAFFPNEAVQIEGETRSFRTIRAAGRWHEASFCPSCGVSLFSRLEVFPHLTGVSVGCFGDPAFDAPSGFYWASRRHHWLPASIGVKVLDTQ